MSEEGLPGDFILRRDKGQVSAVDARIAALVDEIGATDPARLFDFPAGPSGRGLTRRIPLPASADDSSPRALIVRILLRGGLMGPLLGARLLGPERPFAELRTHLRLLEAGAPLARPAFAMAWRRGLTWCAAYATWEERGCIDGLAWLRSRPDRNRLSAGLRSAGRALRRFHDCGGCHADLNASNLMIREKGVAGADPEIIVIDLDRARIANTSGADTVRGAPAARRARELARLARSLQKHLPEAALGPRERARFLRAYFGDDRALRAAVRRHAAREALRSGLHALCYRGVR